LEEEEEEEEEEEKRFTYKAGNLLTSWATISF
jgi:hypothetical protein